MDRTDRAGQPVVSHGRNHPAFRLCQICIRDDASNGSISTHISFISFKHQPVRGNNGTIIICQSSCQDLILIIDFSACIDCHIGAYRESVRKDNFSISCSAFHGMFKSGKFSDRCPRSCAIAADGEIRPGCGCRLDSHFKIRECMRITYGKIKKNRSADNRDSRITDWKSDSLFCQVSHDA